MPAYMSYLRINSRSLSNTKNIEFAFQSIDKFISTNNEFVQIINNNRILLLQTNFTCINVHTTPPPSPIAIESVCKLSFVLGLPRWEKVHLPALPVHMRAKEFHHILQSECIHLLAHKCTHTILMCLHVCV